MIIHRACDCVADRLGVDLRLTTNLVPRDIQILRSRLFEIAQAVGPLLKTAGVAEIGKGLIRGAVYVFLEGAIVAIDVVIRVNGVRLFLAQRLHVAFRARFDLLQIRDIENMYHSSPSAQTCRVPSSTQQVLEKLKFPSSKTQADMR